MCVYLHVYSLVPASYTVPQPTYALSKTVSIRLVGSQKVGHDGRGQSWTVRMSVVVRYNKLELNSKHTCTRTYRYMGTERIYDTATRPELSLIRKGRSPPK